MSDQEDLELQALQRELDDAFATTRPRGGFEDELWLRMQARRPLGSRLRDAIGALWGGLREAPAIPLTAVAVLLVVVVGAGILAGSGLRFGGSSSTALSQFAPDRATAGAAFGRLPTPALHPGLVDSSLPQGLTQEPQAPRALAPSNLYFGPANLRWTGQLPAGSVAAPVFRYTEPGPDAADQFAASLGAATTKQAPAAGYLGTYRGQDFTVTVRGTVAQLPREPSFVLMSSAAGTPGVDAVAVAATFLNRFSLVPSWPNTIDVQGSPAQARVQLWREFPTAGGPAYVVDWNGERYGIEVDVANGQVQTAAGPLPLSLDATTYRLIANDQAVRTALASAPASSQGVQPVPDVNLSSGELVYALAVSGGQGYYEPAYLFSGSFTYNGQTWVKRVLVPLVDPSLRS